MPYLEADEEDEEEELLLELEELLVLEAGGPSSWATTSSATAARSGRWALSTPSHLALNLGRPLRECAQTCTQLLVI